MVSFFFFRIKNISLIEDEQSKRRIIMEALIALAVILVFVMGLLAAITAIVLLTVRGVFNAVLNLVRTIIWGHRLK